MQACLGHNDCCTPEEPCPEGYGDCDTGHDCQEGLYCGENNCLAEIALNLEHAFNSGDDCCVRSKWNYL